MCHYHPCTSVSYGCVSEETLALRVGEVTGQVVRKSPLEKLQPACLVGLHLI